MRQYARAKRKPSNPLYYLLALCGRLGEIAWLFRAAFTRRHSIPPGGPKFGAAVGKSCVYPRCESPRSYKPFLLYKGKTLRTPIVDVAQATIGPIYGAETELRYISRRTDRVGGTIRNDRRVRSRARYGTPTGGGRPKPPAPSSGRPRKKRKACEARLLGQPRPCHTMPLYISSSGVRCHLPWPRDQSREGKRLAAVPRYTETIYPLRVNIDMAPIHSKARRRGRLKRNGWQSRKFFLRPYGRMRPHLDKPKKSTLSGIARRPPKDIATHPRGLARKHRVAMQCVAIPDQRAPRPSSGATL